MVLETTVDFLSENVLPAAEDYEAAERALSDAVQVDATPSHWVEAGRLAKRRSAELAIAIDSLTDRAATELSHSKSNIRKMVSALCFWPGGSELREGCIERVRAAANAYKHQHLSDPSLPISSDKDVLVVGVGYGLDGYGVGKLGGIEVILKDASGQQWKFLGDALVAIYAWLKFLHAWGGGVRVGNYKLFEVAFSIP